MALPYVFVATDPCWNVCEEALV